MSFGWFDPFRNSDPNLPPGVSEFEIGTEEYPEEIEDTGDLDDDSGMEPTEEK